MKVLVITRSSWRTDNSIGNTVEDFFSNWKNAEFHNLSLRNESSKSSVLKSSYHISELQIIKNILNRKNKVGFIEETSINNETNSRSEVKLKKLSINNPIAPFIQESLWSLNTWKTEELKKYILNLSPDIIFMPVFPCVYAHKILKYLNTITDGKIVLFHADDTYSLRQFNLNPLYWIYRFNLRKWVKNSVRISSINYAISDIQKNEYKKLLDIDCKILYKGADFTEERQLPCPDKEITLVYTGNIDLNRWKNLLAIGKTIDELSSNEMRIKFDIYTKTILTKKIKKAFDKLKNTYIRGPISYEKVQEVQKKADILVHTESFDLKNRLTVHQSFSTKIVDYLSSGRCILAVGPDDAASIDYLKKNDAAIIATTEKEIYAKLDELIKDKQLITTYANKALKCGKKNHEIKKIQSGLINDFQKLVK